MHINTRFNRGDHIYFMYKDKIWSGNIEAVITKTESGFFSGRTQVYYEISSVANTIPEEKAFSNKEELIKSL